MTDKELLELAAKAAGYELEERYTKQNEFWPWVEELQTIWNPLTDDGDALRLAVKLQIYVMVVPEENQVNARVRNGQRSFYLEPINNDLYAATRRTIVRAAAAIGGLMK